MSSNLNQLAPSAVDIIRLAVNSCLELGCAAVGSELLLLGVLTLHGRCAAILAQLGLDHERACSFIKATATTVSIKIEHQDLSSDGLLLAPDSKQILSTAHAENLIYPRDSLLEEHLLLAIMREKDTAAGVILRQLNIDLEQLRKRLQSSALNSLEVAVPANTERAAWLDTYFTRGKDVVSVADHAPQDKWVEVPASIVEQTPIALPSSAVRLETDGFAADTVQLLATAQYIALKLEAKSVDCEHLFYAAMFQESFIKRQLVACGAEFNCSAHTIEQLRSHQASVHFLTASEALRKTIGHSMERAGFYGCKQVEPGHLFLAMLDLKIFPATLPLFSHFDMPTFLRNMLWSVSSMSSESGKSAKVSAGLSEAEVLQQLDSIALSILRRASDEAARMAEPIIGTEHLLLALMQVPCAARGLLLDRSIDYEQVLEALNVSQMPSGGDYAAKVEHGPPQVLTDDGLHLLNLAASHANIAGALIMPEDLLLALLVGQTGLAYKALAALPLNLDEIYQALRTGKTGAGPVKSP